MSLRNSLKKKNYSGQKCPGESVKKGPWEFTYILHKIFAFYVH